MINCLREVKTVEKIELKDRLAEGLAIRGMRATDLAEKTGIPKVTISYYMNGKTTPRASNLYLIAQALDVSEAWLLGYDVAIHRSEAQKKNDQLAKLIVRMRTDVDFYETVAALADLTDAQYRGVKQLLTAFKE